MKIKEKSTFVILLFLVLTASQGILAQQTEYFINPKNNTVGAEVYQKADFTQFKYQWEVINNQNDIIIPRNDVPAEQIRERFITSRENIEFIISNIDRTPIRWNGRKPDGELYKDGRYFINVYETAKNNFKIEKKYTYPVTIITEEIFFHIVLESNVINRKTNEKLICIVPPEDEKQVNAYSWKVIIKNSINGAIVEDQPFRSGQVSPFPPFLWDNYLDLDENIINYEIIVEATDRTGTKFNCQNPLAFLIVDSDKIEDSLKEIMKPGETESEGLISDGEKTPNTPINRGDFPINEGIDWSWILSLGYETYIVKPGDYLAKIAREYYGTAYLWGLIYELNKEKFPRQGKADFIKPGMELRLPLANVLENLRDLVKQHWQE